MKQTKIEMENFRYILEPYSGTKSRFPCPGCNRNGTFTRYIDLNKSEYLPFEYGTCNRLVKCGYKLDPYKERFSGDNLLNRSPEPIIIQREIKSSEPSFHSFEDVKKSLKQYEFNSLVTFFTSKFGLSNTRYLIESYYLGTSKKYRETGNGAIIFWNIDINWKVRAGKIFGYNPITGKRIKKPYVLQNWVHKVNPELKDISFNLTHCFFGEHLLNKFLFKPVGLVESEKTALICSLYLPNLVWLATGSLQGISIEKSQALKGRNVFLFPDLSIDGIAFKKWSEKLDFLKSITKSVEISDLLEKIAPESDRENGYDLADYFLSISLTDWNKLKPENFWPNGVPHFSEWVETENSHLIKQNYSFLEYTNGLRFEKGILINGFDYPADWDTISGFKEIDSKTKDFIKLATKNPALLELQKRFGFDLK